MKNAYVKFLHHCYIDTEVENKDLYTQQSIWKIFESFISDMGKVCILFNCEFFKSLSPYLFFFLELLSNIGRLEHN